LANAEQAKIPNAAFGDKDDQIAVHSGISVRNQFESLYILGLQYSQPNEFFRLPGRLSVEILSAFGSGGYSEYNQPFIFGFAQDMVLPLVKPVYAGINLGIYIKSNATERISSKFTFGERAFFGVAVFGDVRIEAYARHFSNGTLTEKNGGQNFVGLAALRSF
jgi:hypothetical protein